MSQERLAFDSGVDRSYVGGMERRTENPMVDVLDRLARTLSVPIAEFLCRTGKGLVNAKAAAKRPSSEEIASSSRNVG
jgi:transcriptional regulator with XRE-family HTH domain